MNIQNKEQSELRDKLLRLPVKEGHATLRDILFDDEVEPIMSLITAHANKARYEGAQYIVDAVLTSPKDSICGEMSEKLALLKAQLAKETT